MGALVDYELDGRIATVTMDDGKVNALSPAMFAELNVAFDRAESDRAVVVLTGRPGMFSAGFDLGVMRGGGRPAVDMLLAGFRLAERMLGFPLPIVVACTGHAIAMGVFLVCAADQRIGVKGDFKIGANEVAIGLTLPWSATEICRQRLSPAYLTRAAITAEMLTPEDAVTAGFLDRLTDAAALTAAARAEADRLAALDPDAFAATKLRVREPALAAVHAGVEKDQAMLESFLS